MKNKAKTYILLALVLAVWGIIGYKILATVNPDTSEAVQEDFNVTFNPETETKIDTFSVAIANKDPFLGTLLVKKKPLKTVKKTKKETVSWGRIVYHGIISKKGTATIVYIISINGQQQLMKLGQEFNGVKLVKGNNKEINVTYKGERKTITKT